MRRNKHESINAMSIALAETHKSRKRSHEINC